MVFTDTKLYIFDGWMSARLNCASGQKEDRYLTVSLRLSHPFIHTNG